METKSRRRESFVDPRRKSLTLTTFFTEEEDETSTVKKPKLSIKHYRESLLAEKEDWKNIFKERKKKCQEAELKLKFEPYTIDRKKIEHRITPEDRSFLDDKPNYMEMITTLQQHLDCLQLLGKFKSDVIDYYNKACDQIEVNNQCLIHQMSANDLCDVCNMKACSLPNHKFQIL